MLAILIEMVYLYAWASGATAKFVGMPRKLKFYQKKSAERLKKLRKLIVDNYVMRNADSSPSRRISYPCIRILYPWLATPTLITEHIKTRVNLTHTLRKMKLCVK